MKGYELVVLIRPDLESDIEKPLTVVRDLITSAGGKIVKEENQGKKRLAYAIDRENFAVYIDMDVELPADAPLKISNTLNITDSVLRYLLVKIDEKGRTLLAEAAKKAEASESAESAE